MPHKCTTCARDFEDGSKEMLSGCPNCGGTTFQYLPDGGTVTESSASADGAGPPDVRSSDPPERPEVPGSTVAETVGRATTKVRKFVSEAPDSNGVHGCPGDDAEITVAAANDTRDDSAENVAQSSARTEMVTSEELPDRSSSAGVAVGSTGNGGVRRDSDSEPLPKPAEPVGEAAGSVGDGPSAGRTHERSPLNSENPVRESASLCKPEGRVVDTPSGESPDISELREELNDQFEGIRILDPGQYELNLMELYEREETIIALRENGRYVIEPPESWRGD